MKIELTLLVVVAAVYGPWVNGTCSGTNCNY
jgi:hypothetical protein